MSLYTDVLGIIYDATQYVNAESCAPMEVSLKRLG